MIRLVLPDSVWAPLEGHFEGAGLQEDGGFLLFKYGRTASGYRLLAHKALLPPADGWEERAEHALRPSGQWLSAAIGAAIDSNSGLAFIHTHPNSLHPPHLSGLDRRTSEDWASQLLPMLRHPFGSFVWSPGGLAGWLFDTDSSTPQELEAADVFTDRSVRTLGRQPGRESRDGQMDTRQATALGDLGNARLRAASIGIVGAGGTGSPLAELLYRMGVGQLIIVDPDRLDEPSNLRRVIGSIRSDLAHRRRKATIVGSHLKRIGLQTAVDVVTEAVETPVSVTKLLDCDVVFATTDTQSSRSFLNQVAMQYWLPVIDVGVRVGTASDGHVSGMPAEIRVLLGSNGCLWCRDVLDPMRIRGELLPESERQQLEREGYITGITQPAPSIAALNVYAASLAVATCLRVWATSLQWPSFISDPWELYVHRLPSEIRSDCICHTWRGRGDEVELPFPKQPMSA